VEKAAKEEELAKVVGVVVDEQDGFGGERLIVGVRNGSEEIGFFQGGNELFAVGEKRGDRFIPG